jgi:hypothetical protein
MHISAAAPEIEAWRVRLRPEPLPNKALLGRRSSGAVSGTGVANAAMPSM